MRRKEALVLVGVVVKTKMLEPRDNPQHGTEKNSQAQALPGTGTMMMR
jgi:hypothetical protein